MVNCHSRLAKNMIKGICLSNSARKTVKNKSIDTVRLCKTLSYYPQHNRIRNQTTMLHNLFSLQTKGSFSLNCSAQHITGGYLRYLIAAHQKLSLRTLTSAGRAKKNEIFTHNLSPASDSDAFKETFIVSGYQM